MQCDALTEWPFLADIKLPEGMWWGEWLSDPCIHSRGDTHVGWVTSIKEGQPTNQITWYRGSEHVQVDNDTPLKDMCVALANFAWTQP